MHHYPFHIPDFNLATRHLSNAEELAYRRMIDLYMDTEKPLLSDCLKIARLVCCDVADVRTVLADFFTEEDDGWHNARCDREIAAYQARSERAKENGAKGGKSRARKASKAKAKQPLSDSQAKAKQPLSDSPPTGVLTKNQEPIVQHSTLRVREAWPELDEVKAYATTVLAPPDCAEKFWNEMEGCGWVRKGTPVANWKPIFRNYATAWKANEHRQKQSNDHANYRSNSSRSDDLNGPGRY